MAVQRDQNDWYSIYLNMTLLQQSLVTVGGRPGNIGPLVLAVGSQTLVEQKTEGVKQERSQLYRLFL